MKGCIVNAIEAVVLTIKWILKREKTIPGIPRNTGEKIVDFQKIGQLTIRGNLQIGGKKSWKNHMHGYFI